MTEVYFQGNQQKLLWQREEENNNKKRFGGLLLYSVERDPTALKLDSPNIT